MRYVVIERAEAGMVLAKSIYDGFGRVLLGCNSIITQEYLDQLTKRGLPGVYVEDVLAADIDVQDTITQELRNKGVDALKNGDIDETFTIAKQIVEEILDKPEVSLDVIDLKTYDDYTFSHSVNVAVLSTIIGMNMEFNKESLQELCVSAILHDIGKLMISPEILNKPGKLTEQEYEIVKNHPKYAYEVMKQRIDISACVRAGVLSHHENEDGSGYPSGLEDEQIYIYAKIIHVADVFDALTSKRPYKAPYERSEAIEYLMGSCGRMFDMDVVCAFMKSVPLYPKGTSVYLSDGREAIVVENKKNTLRPVIRLMDGTEMDLGNMKEFRNVTIGFHPNEKVTIMH